MRAFLAHTTAAVSIVLRHATIPKPLRALAAIGLLPIPGPVDEIVLLLVTLILALFYRAELRRAWAEARPSPVGTGE